MNQRLSLEEVQEIARLAAQRRAVVHGQGPTVDRVADALGLPPGQVDSLLAEIRDRKAGLIPPDDATTFKRLGLGAAALVALGIAVVVFNLLSGSGPKEPAATTGGSPSASFGSPTARSSVSVMPTAPSGSPAAAAAPSTPIDPGLSSGTLPLGREEVKDYSTDVHNARTRADEEFSPFRTPKKIVLSER